MYAGWTRPIVLLFFSGLLFSVAAAPGTHYATAEAGEATPQVATWRVLETAGSVRYRLPGGSSWSRAAVGDVLPPGSRIVTDEGGTLVIERSGEEITMRPNARFMLPPGYNEHRARQEVGSLQYQITKSQNRRFEVETPYAALVVKGTAFDVDVNQDGIAIDVRRGVVGVESRGGATADLGAGHAARVSAAGSHALEVRRQPEGPFVPVEPARASWFRRFLNDLQAVPAPVGDQDGGGHAGGGGSAGAGTGGAGTGGAGTGASAGRGGVGVGGASVGGASVGGVSAGRGGVSVGGASVGGVSVGGISAGRGGVSVGGASVGGVSVGGVSAGRGGVSVGGVSVGGGGIGRGGRR